MSVIARAALDALRLDEGAVGVGGGVNGEVAVARGHVGLVLEVGHEVVQRFHRLR